MEENRTKERKENKLFGCTVGVFLMVTAFMVYMAVSISSFNKKAAQARKSEEALEIYGAAVQYINDYYVENGEDVPSVSCDELVEQGYLYPAPSPEYKSIKIKLGTDENGRKAVIRVIVDEATFPRE